MATKKSRKKSKKKPLTLFVPEQISGPGGDVAMVPGSGGHNLHAMSMLGGLREYTLDWQKFEKSWKQTRDQIGEILQDMGGDSFGNMELTDLEVGLSISGKGTVGIASVSGAATITLKFKVK